MIAKISFFLLSNLSNELNYLKEDISEMESKILIKECGLFNNNNAENDDDDEDYSVLDILPLHEVHVLIDNDIINLNNHESPRMSITVHQMIIKCLKL
ncbi:unnamed protein product [Rhizophagus irregularis]|nr:unnamed protein product [Rhizophagus irregularis]